MPKAFSNVSARGIKNNYIYINEISRINRVVKE